MNEFLKVKLKSLAEEARIIRHEKRRAKARARWLRKNASYRADATDSAIWKASMVVNNLHKHNVQVVRKEQRASYLAYGFLRGMPYKRIEQRIKSEPDWDRVQNIASRFTNGENGYADPRVVAQKIAEWKDAK